jgi:hypothetical protein
MIEGGKAGWLEDWMVGKKNEPKMQNTISLGKP